MNTLQTAIEKALENGWDMFEGQEGIDAEIYDREWKMSAWNSLVVTSYHKGVGMSGYTVTPYQDERVLFNINFAKALFDDIRTLETNMRPSWEYHLQQLAIAEDRLKYLQDWLEGER